MEHHPPQRQFADIAGYSALMQKVKLTASTLHRSFQKEIEEKVAGHRSHIINFYGDGALCTFKNPLEVMLETKPKEKPPS